MMTGFQRTVLGGMCIVLTIWLILGGLLLRVKLVLQILNSCILLHVKRGDLDILTIQNSHLHLYTKL